MNMEKPLIIVYCTPSLYIARGLKRVPDMFYAVDKSSNIENS